MIRIAMALACLGLISPAPEKTIYVSPDGSNENSGTSPKEPVKAIWKAIELAGEKGIVKVAAGDYKGRADSGILEVKGSVTIQGGWSKDFAKRDPFVTQTRLIGSGEGKTPLRADAEEGQEIVLDGLTVNGDSVNDYTQGSLSYREAQVPLILVKTRNKGSSVKVTNCLVTNGSNAGIIAESYIGPITISNCVILGARPAAVQVSTNNRAAVTIENNTLLCSWRTDLKAPFPYDCGNAVLVEGRVGTITIKGNLMGYSEGIAVRNVGGANKTIKLLANGFVENPKGIYVTEVNNKTFAPKAEEMGDADLLEYSGNKVLDHKFEVGKPFRTKFEKLHCPLLTAEEIAPFLPSEKMPAGYGAQAVK